MDEDDKVRRNLVVFSAGVLGIAWFELPIQQLASQAMNTTPLSPLKTWSAAAVVHLYLLLRYRFSAEAQRLTQQVREHQSRAHWAGVMPFVTAEAESAFKTGRANATFGREIQVLTSQVKSMLITQQAEESFGKLKLHVQIDQGPTIWGGWASLVVQDGLMPFRVQYEVPGPARTRIRAVALVKSWVYSDTGVNLVLPYVLSACAIVVIVWKYVTALF
jgi:hypothetical protein